MKLEFILRFDSTSTGRSGKGFSMSEWAKDAYKKFVQKRENEQLSDQIIRSQGSYKFLELRENFTREVEEFNSQGDHRRMVLTMYTGDDGWSFDVNRTNTPKTLKVTYDQTKHAINITGVSGVQYQERFAVQAELHGKTAFLIDSKNHPAPVPDIVAGALNALLEI